MEHLSLYKAFVMNSSSDFQKLYQERYNSESSLKFPLEINGNPAFFFYSPAIANLALEIRDQDKKLENILNRLPLMALKQYMKKSLIDEIEFTNQIEGVLSTRKEINEILSDVDKKKNDRIHGIVRKYEMLMDGNVGSIVKSSQEIREIYDEMLKEEIMQNDKKNLPDGLIFRKDVVHIYNQGKSIHEGVYPETKIVQYMDQALNILNDENIDILIRVSIFHYLFGYIHPFYDGNGRVNRYISSSYLYLRLTPVIGFCLSMTIKENLSKYYKAFKETNDARNKGDISTFVYEFLLIILEAYKKSEMYALDQCNQLEYYRNLIEKIKLSKKKENILDTLVQCELFSTYGARLKDIMANCNISRSTCSSLINELIKSNFVSVNNIGRSIFYTANLKAIEAYK